MGRNAPLANLSKSRHFKSESRATCTDRPTKSRVPGRFWAPSTLGSLGQPRFDPAPPFCLPFRGSSLGIPLLHWCRIRTDRQIRSREGGGEMEGLGAQLLESVRGRVEVPVGSDRGSPTTPGGRRKFHCCEISASAYRAGGVRSGAPDTQPSTAPSAKHRNSRHFHPDSTVKPTGRPTKLPGPGPLLGSIPLGLCPATSLRSGSPLSLPAWSRHSLRFHPSPLPPWSESRIGSSSLVIQGASLTIIRASPFICSISINMKSEFWVCIPPAAEVWFHKAVHRRREDNLHRALHPPPAQPRPHTADQIPRRSSLWGPTPFLVLSLVLVQFLCPSEATREHPSGPTALGEDGPREPKNVSLPIT